MDQLGDLLPSNLPKEPQEFTKIKKFIKEQIGCESRVRKQSNGLTVSVPDSISAFNLRLRYLDLQRQCEIQDKIFIRISPDIAQG